MRSFTEKLHFENAIFWRDATLWDNFFIFYFLPFYEIFELIFNVFYRLSYKKKYAF